MKYDFDRVIDRSGTDSSKWNVSTVFGSHDVLPMWVADMDFPIAKPITDALRKRMEHEVYGYAYARPSLLQAVIDRMKRRYDWKVQPEWIVFTPGVVPALNAAIRAYTHPGDEVIIQDPVYHPFWSAVEQSGCCVASNPMRLVRGRYHLDLDDLESKFASKELMRRGPSRVRMLLLCSPHNPTGRVWSRDELKAVGRVIISHGAIVVSDEVHCELLYRGVQHTPFAAISKEFEQNCMVCQAGSKTFNLAGLAASTIIVPNPRLRSAFNAARAGILPQPDVFGLVALEAAYREGDEWLSQVLEYLQGNLDFLVAYVQQNLPGISVIKPQGTYLVWLDCRRLGMDHLALRLFFREKAKVGLDDGYIFGPGGAGFERMNIACPRSTLEEALHRIKGAVDDLKSV
jgi:cysteine-S-conjugate beta-lyase